MAAGDGLIVMQPTSIAVAGAGSSASINSDGGVDFTSATSLSLNGVFTSSFDNYLIVYGGTQSVSAWTEIRYRSSGTDASGSNYTWQLVRAYGSSYLGVRVSSATHTRLVYTGSNPCTVHVHVYGPALAQPTAYRVVSGTSEDSAEIYDVAGTHSLSTSYDGFTLLPNGQTITGNIAVFGYEE